jgi:hypothetical protein
VGGNRKGKKVSLRKQVVATLKGIRFLFVGPLSGLSGTADVRNLNQKNVTIRKEQKSEDEKFTVSLSGALAQALM